MSVKNKSSISANDRTSVNYGTHVLLCIYVCMHAYINLCVFSHLIIRKKRQSCFELEEAKLIDISSSQGSQKRHPVQSIIILFTL